MIGAGPLDPALRTALSVRGRPDRVVVRTETECWRLSTKANDGKSSSRIAAGTFIRESSVNFRARPTRPNPLEWCLKPQCRSSHWSCFSVLRSVSARRRQHRLPIHRPCWPRRGRRSAARGGCPPSRRSWRPGAPVRCAATTWFPSSSKLPSSCRTSTSGRTKCPRRRADRRSPASTATICWSRRMPGRQPAGRVARHRPRRNKSAAARAARAVAVKQDFARLMLGLFADVVQQLPAHVQLRRPGRSAAGHGRRARSQRRAQPHDAVVRLQGHSPAGDGHVAGAGARRGRGPGPWPRTRGARRRAARAPPGGSRRRCRARAARVRRHAPENRIYFADYREVDGVKFPFRLRRASRSGHG